MLCYVQELYQKVSFMLCYIHSYIPKGKHLSCCVMYRHSISKSVSDAVLCTDTLSGGLYIMLCLVHSHHTRKYVMLRSICSTLEVRVSHYTRF
jgi:hypothetical protein